MNELKYPASIRPLSAEEGGGFLIEFPDLPGCIADGDTVEEALNEAADALNAWLKTAAEFNDPIPVPSVPTNFSGQWRLRIPKSLHAELTLRAKQEGVSLNTLAATILAMGLGKMTPEKSRALKKRPTVQVTERPRASKKAKPLSHRRAEGSDG